MQVAASEHEGETGRREQVLDRARREQVDAQRSDVERDRTRCLIAVRETERPSLVRDARDFGNVEAIPGAVRDRGAADERRPLVDGLGEALERDPAVRVGSHVHDLGAPELLRMRDLTHGRELELGDHDPGSSLLQRERADEGAHRLRDRGRDRHLRGLGAYEPCEGRAGRVRSFDPVLPLGAVLVPSGEVLLVRAPHVDRERALRARVRVGRVLEDGEASPHGRSDTLQQSVACCHISGLTLAEWC